MAQSLESIMSPLLHPAIQANPLSLVNAVNSAAFDLACTGMLITDRDGKVIHGLKDEEVIILTLEAYSKKMHEEGKVDIALEASRAKNLIKALKIPGPTKPIRTRILPPKPAMQVKRRKEK